MEIVQLISRVRLFVTPWTAAPQSFLAITISQSLLKVMSIESMMPFNHLVLKQHQKQTNKTTRIPLAKSLLYFASLQSSSKPGYILSILLSVIIWKNLFKFLLLSLYPIPHFNFYTILSLSYRWTEWTPKLSCSKLSLIISVFSLFLFVSLILLASITISSRLLSLDRTLMSMPSFDPDRRNSCPGLHALEQGSPTPGPQISAGSGWASKPGLATL